MTKEELDLIEQHKKNRIEKVNRGIIMAKGFKTFPGFSWSRAVGLAAFKMAESPEEQYDLKEAIFNEGNRRSKMKRDSVKAVTE